MNIIKFIFLIPFFIHAATYYYISGPLNQLSSWNTNTNGSGTSPTSFLTGNHTFIIWNSLSPSIHPTLNAVWNFGGNNILQIGNATGAASLTISGGTLNLQGNAYMNVGVTTGTLAAKLILASNGLINITTGVTNAIRVLNGATLTIFSTNFPAGNRVSLNTGTPGSTVEWMQNSNVTIWLKTYANMVVGGSGIKTLTAGTTRILRQLSMNSGAIQMDNTTSSILRISGTITGTAPIRTANSNITIDGTGNVGTITFTNGITNQTIRNLTLNRSGLGVVTVGSDFTVTATTNWSNGVLNLNGKQVTFQGAITFPASATNGFLIGSYTSSLTISGAGAITNSLRMSTSTATTSSLARLVMNRSGTSLSIASVLNIRNELAVTNGTVNSGGNIFIKADANQKARVAPLGTNASITGNVTVETFAPSGATGWTNLSACGVSNQSVSAWTDDFYISCPSGCPITFSFTSIYSYNEPAVTNCYSCAAHYIPTTGSTQALQNGIGYYVYLGTSTYTTSNIHIDMTGPLVMKNAVTIPLTLTGPVNTDNGWNLIGNPFASPISFTNILSSMGASSNNIVPTIYVWNPDLNGGSGDFASYNITSGSMPPLGSGGVGNDISIGQGFFVRVLNNVNLVTNENWKSSTNVQNPLLKVNSNAIPTLPHLLTLKLSGPNQYETYTGISVHPSSTYGFDNLYDVYFLGSSYPAPRFMSLAGGKECKINCIPSISPVYTVELKALTGVTGTYTISASNLNSFLSGVCISLYDKFTGMSQNLNSGSYVFTLHDTTTVPRFILTLQSQNLPASINLAQKPSCNSSSDGYVVAQTPVTYSNMLVSFTWKDGNGNVLKSSQNTLGADTLKNISPGIYYCDISIPSSCAGTLVSIKADAQNTVVPVASVQMISNDTLALDFNHPFVAQAQVQNASQVWWELLGDGFTQSGNTFSYMPSEEGQYLLRLHATNNCGEEVYADMPLLVLPGPASPDPEDPVYWDKPETEPYDQVGDSTTVVTHISQNTVQTHGLSVDKDNHGWYVSSPADIPDGKLQIYDLTGKLLADYSLNLHKNEKLYLNTSTLPPVVMIAVFTETGTVKKKIFIEQK